MNKKLFLTCFLFATLLSHAFAQTSFIDSAKSMATVGEFSSDADNVVANDIADIKSGFFSLGYQEGTVGVFGAMLINTDMTFGLAAEYSVDSIKTESYDVDGSTSVTSGHVFNENSSFNIRPVFKYKNMAFHYRIFRGGDNNSTFSKETLISSGDVVSSSTVATDGAQWEHEIGFYYDKSTFNIYIPMGIIINDNKTTTKSTNVSGSTTTEVFSDDRSTGYNDSDIGTTTLYINPKFVLPLNIGPLTQIAIRLDASFDVYNTGGAYNSTTIETTGDTTITTDVEASSKDQAYVAFDLYANPSFAWTIDKAKMDLALDITAGLKYAYDNAGLVTTITTTTTETSDVVTDTDTDTDASSVSSDYTNTISPYLEIAFGALVNPFSWLQLRTGVACDFEWVNQISTVDYTAVSGGKVCTLDYALVSSLDIAAGVGFIVTEGFTVDAYIEIGRSVSLEDDFSITTSSFGITSWGAQLTYKF